MSSIAFVSILLTKDEYDVLSQAIKTELSFYQDDYGRYKLSGLEYPEEKADKLIILYRLRDRLSSKDFRRI